MRRVPPQPFWNHRSLMARFRQLGSQAQPAASQQKAPWVNRGLEGLEHDAYFPILGGSRKAMAKNKVASANVRMRM
jgi:hypothetical protein